MVRDMEIETMQADYRYTYARATSYERMADIMEDCFASGDISHGEWPRIESHRDHSGKVTHYELTLSSV